MKDFHGARALYVGASFDNGIDKRRALTRLGLELVDFDARPYLHLGPRWQRSAARRLNVGPAIAAFNRDLLRTAAGAAPIDLVWVDKGQWMQPETLEAIREVQNAILVHYCNDSMLLSNRSRPYRESVRHYDYMFTTKDWEIQGHRWLGAKRIFHLLDGVDEERFVPTEPSLDQRRAFGSDLLFVGRCEPHYARCLGALAALDADLRIWGPRWPRYARLHRWARQCVRGPGIWRGDYPVALGAARISIGLLSKRFPDAFTTRTFEIPAVGGFLLAERTPQHQALYREGEEAEFFSSREELLEKARHYLSHPEKRDRIAAAGRRRFLEGGYTRTARFREALEIVFGDRP